MARSRQGFGLGNSVGGALPAFADHQDQRAPVIRLDAQVAVRIAYE